MRPTLLVAVLLAAVACSAEPETPAPTPAGPYVVAAVDYHFHDAHPSDPIRLGRGVEFSNQGSNIHNVTFEDVDFNEDIQPADELTIDPISEVLAEPGRYRFVCKFHADRGMTGVLVIEG